MNYDREYILRYIEGSLSPDAASALKSDLAGDYVLRARVECTRDMQLAIKSVRADSFALGFGDRVLARMRGAENGEVAMYRGLSWVFRRAAIASLVAAVALGALNLASYR